MTGKTAVPARIVIGVTDAPVVTTFEPGRGLNSRIFEDLDAFSSERADKRRVGEKLGKGEPVREIKSIDEERS